MRELGREKKRGREEEEGGIYNCSRLSVKIEENSLDIQ